ncbi:Ig-like domain-containing protein [Microbacterium sp. NPDC089189]|uniref:Ig-like domain-containing protein n=1 Tax=Microbacterium sp. NPDC089189 TaxID=3154972 RepID=UPI00342C9082
MSSRHPRFPALRRAVGLGLAVAIAGALLATAQPSSARADDGCDVVFDTTTSAAGFTHPGVGVTVDELANVRTQLAAGAEPWASYYAAMASSPAAATTVTSSNRDANSPTSPAVTAFDSQAVNSRFIADGLKAYTQALMYVFTGEQVYRDNAMAIIRIWSQMDPAAYAAFPDAHIHTGIPLNRMVTAAELLRYGGCEDDATPWTQADTDAFSAHLVRPVIETYQSDQNHFMNQHNYPLIGSMAGYVFLDDAAGYERAVEWFTVNATAEDQGFNGSIERLFRLVTQNDATGEPLATPRVQHVEMGRDQAHGGGDITNAYMLARTMMAQGTRVDPVAGTVSSAGDAVGPYEFLDDRILAAADYFWEFMLGRDPEWTPVGYAISADGTVRDTYDRISNAYRGRYNTAGFWDLYYYYTYDRGVDLAQAAPSYLEAFDKRLPPDFFYRGAVTRAWDNVDGGGDFWLHVPAAAAGTAVPAPQTSATEVQIEDRFADIAGSPARGADGDSGYVSLQGSDKISLLNASTASKRVALRVRTDGEVDLRLSFGLDRTVVLPDTDGAWRQVVVELSGTETIGDLLYLEVADGDGRVDVDSLRVDTSTLAPLGWNAPVSTAIVAVGDDATIDLAADGGDALAYTASGLPAGAQLDPQTGQVTWAPTVAGNAAVLLSVDDGQSIAARRVQLRATVDREAAVVAASDRFDPATGYERATRTPFLAAQAAASDAVGGSAVEFSAAVDDLVAAGDALREISPTSADGRLIYPDLLASSTAGTSAGFLDDDDPQTGTSYGQAQNLAHVFDFGPGAKVSAEQFGLRSNIFEDRLANSAVFGSNDGVTWTRLTPGVTTMTQDYQTLTVAPELRDERFQFLKVQLLEPLPDVLYGTVRGLFELTEFHIYGERTETVGDLTSIGISAPGSLKGRAVAGDPVRVQFTSAEVISGVTVTIAGVVATADTDDGRSWSAQVALPEPAASGRVAFEIGHTTSEGVAADAVRTTSDGSSVYASSDDGLIDGVLQAARVIGLDGTPSPTHAADAARLFDHDIATHSDTRLAAGRASIEWDLGEGAAVAVTGADVLVRQDQYGTTRLSSLRFEGSDDRQTWVPLTSNVTATSDWQRLAGLDADAYRYVRLTNGNIINVAEVRLFGTHEAPVSDLTSLTLRSDHALGNYAVDGSVVSADLVFSDPPSHVAVSIDGQGVDAEPTGVAGHYRAQAVIAVDDRLGQQVAVAVEHTTAAGREAVPVRATTDGSAVRLGTDEGLLAPLTDRAATVTLAGAPDTSAVARPRSLFDNALSTSTDARVINGSADIVFDLGDAHTVALDRVELALRQDAYGTGRLKNLRLLGSDDLAQWHPIVSGVQPTLAWQGIDAAADAAGRGFRYLRLTNEGILGVAELRLYGEIASPIVAIDAVAVQTYRNDLPVLPETVAVSRADGTHEVVAVAWELPAESAWSADGTVEIAGTVEGTTVPARAVVTVRHDGSTAAPAVGVLHSDEGWDTGLSDGTYAVVVDLWWGENARRAVLLENGVEIARADLSLHSPAAQRMAFDVADRANGRYTYVVRLVNSTGSSETAPLMVEVAHAAPHTPVLSDDNADGDGSYSVTADLWWGTNASSYAFFENGVEIAGGQLDAASPGPQRAVASVSARPAGRYDYRVVFTNAAGSTESSAHVVTVR